jgi:tetratricopeptide (TPR) repeat protein
MTPLRLVGIVVLVFLVSLPAMHKGLPGSLLSGEGRNEQDAEDTDDPAVDMLCLKGLGYVSDEHYDKAIAAYTEAIRRDPKYSFAYLGRGNAYMAKGDQDRALLDYDKAVRLDPTNEAAQTLAKLVRQQRSRQ